MRYGPAENEYRQSTVSALSHTISMMGDGGTMTGNLRIFVSLTLDIQF